MSGAKCSHERPQRGTGALAGLCPKCLFEQGLAKPALKVRQPFTPPPLESLAKSIHGVELIELIGQGGMGAVYKGRQYLLNRLVAVKILPPTGADGGSIAVRFAQEARVLARLSHPNIVAIHAYGLAGALGSIATDMMPSGRKDSGCHWCAIPGREYTVNDCVKVNLATVFEVALKDMMSDQSTEPSMDTLWRSFEKHLRRSIETVAQSLDFHMDHMYRVFPELHLDLLCYGPIEKGRDASHGGVEFYNLCVDGAGLATVADSFAAVEQRVEREKKITWNELARLLETNWSGENGERMRLMMKSIPRYGSGGSKADTFGVNISKTFTQIVKEKPTPHGFNLIPGIFSWAATIAMGKDVGATPNGRYSQSPISHGPNPDPGFRKDAAPTALAVTVASVQPGYGNTAPMQIELDPGLSKSKEDIEKVVALIRTHFELGGTQINMNILNKKAILEAHKDPNSHPDLVVRVTGFSAYFASLSPEMRQIVVDRIIAEE